MLEVFASAKDKDIKFFKAIINIVLAFRISNRNMHLFQDLIFVKIISTEVDHICLRKNHATLYHQVINTFKFK